MTLRRSVVDLINGAIEIFGEGAGMFHGLLPDGKRAGATRANSEQQGDEPTETDHRQTIFFPGGIAPGCGYSSRLRIHRGADQMPDSTGAVQPPSSRLLDT